MNVAQYLVEQLRVWGVQRVYGLVGDAILDFVDALEKAGGPRFVAVRHEASAAFMASAEAKLSGRPACCTATTGPGAVNLLNGLADAALDQVPLLAITGQSARSRIGTDQKQYFDQQRLFSSVAGFSQLVAAPEALPAVLPLAWRAMLGEGKAAHLSVPMDLWRAEVKAPVRQEEPYLGARHHPAIDVVRGAAHRMGQSARPVIVCGHGARTAREALIALAERWQAPIVRSLGGIGVVPGHHPLVVGGYGAAGSAASHRLLQQADMALVVGTTWWPHGHVPLDLPIVQIDVRPGNVGRDAEVAWGIVGDAAAVLPTLLEAVEPASRPDWLSQAQALRRDWEARVAPLRRAGGPPVSPGYLVTELEQAIAPDAVVVLDVGDHVLWFGQFFRGEQHRVLFSGTWRSMGFGIPAAIAAALCSEGRQVVALVGDGGLAMSAGELSTVAQLGVPVTVVVADNGWLAMEKNRMDKAGLASEATRLPAVDLVKLAEASGLRAWRVEAAGQLPDVLRAALGCGGPALVDVPVVAGPPPDPRVTGG